MSILSLLNNLFFKVIAFLLSNDFVLNWLIKYSYDKPYVNITRDGMTVYMERWWLMPKWALVKYQAATPPGIQSYRRSWLPFSIRLHHICRPDFGMYLHDHPGNYRAIILKGGYVEEDIFGVKRFYGAGTTRRASALNFHSIVEVPEKGAWTIFIMGRHYNQWGFLVNNRKVHWKDHVSS